jgi:hypothetical protein
MTALNASTRRRLQNLPQVPSVWEGDRRSLAPNLSLSMEPDSDIKGECILWVDGTEAMVRSMDVVPPDVGQEAVVRALLRAMEYPHSSSRPARPQKIVVRDRELQFYLRGVLQDLGIVIDYTPELPMIDEIFRGLQEVADNRPPQLPPERVDALQQIAYTLWQDAPWEELDEEKILSIDLNYGDIGTLYISILGMLGMEFGILMYRSLESLKTFRERVLAAHESTDQLEGAFLEQDCFFLTYDQLNDEDSDRLLSSVQIDTGVEPSFGNLHPLEGMRPVLYEEEAIAVLLALTGLHRFFQQHLKKLENDQFPALVGRYRLPDPVDPKKRVAVTVSTLPDVAAELEQLTNDLVFVNGPTLGLQEAPQQVLRDDLVPRDVFYSLGSLPWETLDILRMTARVHQAADAPFPAKGDGLPVILLQASRPKALALIEGLQAEGGLKAICFNPGADPFAGERYDLGVLQTQSGELHLFGEFIEDEPIHIQARKKWDQRCKKTNGYCGLVIAKGLKGANRGNPDINDMMALFEVHAITHEELGLGFLELMPQF